MRVRVLVLLRALVPVLVLALMPVLVLVAVLVLVPVAAPAYRSVCGLNVVLLKSPPYAHMRYVHPYFVQTVSTSSSTEPTKTLARGLGRSAVSR